MDYSEVLRTDCAKEFRLPKSAGEDNWKSRMDFCNKMTTTIDNYGNSHLPKDFTAQIEPYLNNLLDCARSERTQLSNSACKLLGALPKVLERDMHPHLDRILPDLIKLCANTKQVTVKIAAAAVANIIQYSTYNPRLLWHVCQVFEDKAPGPKQNGTAWLQTLMKEYHRSMDLHKDSRMISRALHLALEDADAVVRTNSRATYWTYSRLDADSAAEIMEKLDQHKRNALQSDPHNPDKKNILTKKQPPRPRSALAEVRKEQAKKKRAEEEAVQKQQKAFTASTAGHDNIEIHEPRKDKPKKEEKGFKLEHDRAGAGAALVDRTSKDLPQWSQKREQKAHKKALSQDDEVVMKPSASSRLLSAPVRRPRINVTPMNGPQPAPARPSSRTGHIGSPHTNGQQATSSGMSRAGHTTQPKEIQKDSRPTSSSSSKSATVLSFAASTPATENRRPMSSPNSKAVSTTALVGNVVKSNVVTESKQYKQPGILASTPSTQTRAPPPYIPDGKENAAVSSWEAKRSGSQEGPEVIPVNKSSIGDNPGDLASAEPEETDTSMSALNDRISAMRFLIKIPSTVTNNLLICRKLKSIIEHYPDIIDDETVFDRIFIILSRSLATKVDLVPSKSHAAYPYSRQLILQTTIPLIQQYGKWSHKYRPDWIQTMIFYRCTLPHDPKDRRTELCLRNISTVISGCPNPLDFIPSVVSAIDVGEGIILRGTILDQEKEDPKLGDNGMGHFLLETIKESQSKHTTTIITSNEQYPRELDNLYETALSALAIILEQGRERNRRLTARAEEELCQLAQHTLKTHTSTVKRSVISFIEHLQLIMDNDQKLLSHFTEESQVNLLEYYMSETRRKYETF